LKLPLKPIEMSYEAVAHHQRANERESNDKENDDEQRGDDRQDLPCLTSGSAARSVICV